MSTDTLALVGALTGAVGVLTGVAALAWQIVTHRASGRVVTVRCTNIIPIYGPSHAPEFRDDDQVAVDVLNRGGAPVTVTNYGVSMAGKGGKRNLFVTAPPDWATHLPAAVQPGGEPVRLLIPTAALETAHEDGIAYRRMRPWVELGDGRRIYSKAVPLK